MCLLSPPLPLLLLLSWLGPAAATAVPGCKIRITAKGLELVKQEGLRFVEQELENLTLGDLHGKEGQFHYNISNVRVTQLQLALSDLHFQPRRHLVFSINNASISLRFRRQLLYWFFYDVGSINTTAEGVHIHTVLALAKDAAGRLKISNISCNASIARMHAGFSGTLRKVYQFLATFITTGMRYLLNQQICPVLDHAGLVLLNNVLDTVPVRSPVDEHIGIDYALLNDPLVTADTLDMNFKGMFFPLRGGGNETLLPGGPAVEPFANETARMVYLAVSENFFDSALFAYHQAGMLSLELAGAKVPKDLEVLLRATLFGNIIMTESRLSAKVALQKKALQMQLDLRRFRIYSNQSVLESLALIPLQTPLKTLLQLTIMPLINERTKKGVQIPLPEGMDFLKEVVTNHMGYLTIGADLHFSKGLREVIEKYRTGPAPWPTSVAA
ncbi:phospholipid transfer protein isoform X2 [Hemicordylus capensis]|uniref:phospholipid transfer protein isoform X2 n=1 Tax=Hemicordylus capensis TaxID=884348 RepID=UPI00230420E2|nr:phospholipid transfer protein isoform X2 [Hemicordylus capensis]